MTARAFLLRGLLAGLLAGFATFLVAHQVGEPSVERAVALENAPAPSSGSAAHDEPAGGHTAHTHSDGGTTVSRGSQRTWGLLTGTVAVGVALGGIIALVAAGVVGRLGRLTPGQSTAVVTLVGFVAFALVPFLKYPANPPAVGSADTIGSRTGYYFLFVVISVVTAVAGTVLASRLWERWGAYAAVVSGTGLYLVVMVVAGVLMPTVNEVGGFPADTLWFFRRASVLTLATMWAVIGVALTGLVGRLHRETSAVTARRELAASL
jgi:predicted cobalt transporter CbtA